MIDLQELDSGVIIKVNTIYSMYYGLVVNIKNDNTVLYFAKEFFNKFSELNGYNNSDNPIPAVYEIENVYTTFTYNLTTLKNTLLDKNERNRILDKDVTSQYKKHKITIDGITVTINDEKFNKLKNLFI